MKLDTVFKILLILVILFSIQNICPIRDLLNIFKKNIFILLIKNLINKILYFDIYNTKEQLIYFFHQKEVTSKSIYYIFFGLFAILTFIVKFILNQISNPIAEKLIPKRKWSKRIRKIKIQRFNLMFFNLFYFVLISFFGYHTLKNESYFPIELGGKGILKNYFINLQNQKTSNLIHLYYFLNGGYLLTAIYSLLILEKLPDFYENFLQHLCALILVYFSYSYNFLRVGAVIMLCHDICEIFSSACRVFVDTSYKFITVTSFGILFTSWGYLRLYTFSKRCILAIYRNLEIISPILKMQTFVWLIFLLLVMLLMNTYWFILMAKMLIHFISSGKTEDILARDTEIEKKKKYEKIKAK